MTVSKQMAAAKQAEIDQLMLEKYQAKRSIVTTHKWCQTHSDCWVCAYAVMPADKKEKPILYMVHWVSTSPEGTTIIYKAI